MVECSPRLTPGSTWQDHGRMTRDAGIQLMVCSSTAGAPGPSHPVTLTTVAQECVYFGHLGVDCEPNTRMKYRSPGGAAMAAACRGEISSAGVGGLGASGASPPAAHPPGNVRN